MTATAMTVAAMSDTEDACDSQPEGTSSSRCHRNAPRGKFSSAVWTALSENSCLVNLRKPAPVPFGTDQKQERPSRG